MSDDLKERLTESAAHAKAANERVVAAMALARIEALEAQLSEAKANAEHGWVAAGLATDQLAEARKALSISLTAMALASGFEVISLEFEFRHAIKAVRDALPQPPSTEN